MEKKQVFRGRVSDLSAHARDTGEQWYKAHS